MIIKSTGGNRVGSWGQ